MTVLSLLLLGLAAAMFLIAMLGWGDQKRLIAAGLFLWVLAPICQYANSL